MLKCTNCIFTARKSHAKKPRPNRPKKKPYKGIVTGQEFCANFKERCCTRCTLYLATCNICAKQYVVNTTQAIRGRIKRKK